MKCPHCGYHHGWCGETMASIEGERGTFYHLPVELERQAKYTCAKERINLYACPSCSKTFID